MHRLAVITVSIRLMHAHTLPHMHASPRSNDREHAYKDTIGYSSTCMYRLLRAITACTNESNASIRTHKLMNANCLGTRLGCFMVLQKSRQGLVVGEAT